MKIRLTAVDDVQYAETERERLMSLAADYGASKVAGGPA
jgi:hypothetical protein